MKKYELIKPLLGVDVLKIEEVFTLKGEYYNPESIIVSNESYFNHILHKDVVENNPEYFKLVEEVGYIYLQIKFKIIENNLKKFY